jgi:hypothetical protein
VTYISDEILNDPFGNVWEYEPRSSDFAVRVKKAGGLFNRGAVVERTFKYGDNPYMRGSQ